MGHSLLRLSAAATGVRQSIFATLQGRIEAFRAQGGELIPLQIGDTYLLPPAAALALQREDHREISAYGSPPGLVELRDAIAGFRRARGLTAADGAANVHVGCGCTHALFCAVRALIDPGDEVLVASPYWPLFPGLLKTAGGRLVDVPVTGELYRDDGVDIQAQLEAKRSGATRAIYIITPNNPDGMVYSRAQLEQVAAFAKRHDLWVLSDEVYADFVYSGEHVSIATLPGMAERTVTSFSLSKSHALAGARIGYVVAPERVIDATRRISNHTVYNVPVAMQRVAHAALIDSDDWLKSAHATYRAARDATAAALDEAGLSYDLPRGGSFFFFDVSEQLGERPMQELLERGIDHGVLLAPGGAFGQGCDGYVRLCFTGVPVDQVCEGVSRFAKALGSLG
jgi:aspartate/methionine/tyrosine aminotransferase